MFFCQMKAAVGRSHLVQTPMRIRPNSAGERVGIMPPKWKAAIFWFAFPYLFYVLFVPTLALVSGRAVDFRQLFRWSTQIDILSSCAVTAALGTMILWIVPIHRAWLGLLIGPIVAIGAISLWAWVQLTFFGGFERNIGIYIIGMTTLLPSCLAGGYAGLLRFKERQPTRRARPLQK